DGLALVGAQDVDLAGLGERLEGPVDGGEPEVLAGLPQPGVEVLGRGEVPGPLELGGDRGLLAGGAPAGCGHRVLPPSSCVGSWCAWSCSAAETVGAGTCSS